MKKYLIFLLVLGGIGCSKSTPEPATASIVGKWYYKSTRDQHKSSTGATLTDATTTNFPDGDYLLFNSNGTGGLYDNRASSPLDTFTYSISGSTEKETTSSGSTINISITITSTTLTRHAERTNSDGTRDVADENLSR